MIDPNQLNPTEYLLYKTLQPYYAKENDGNPEGFYLETLKTALYLNFTNNFIDDITPSDPCYRYNYNFVFIGWFVVHLPGLETHFPVYFYCGDELEIK
jgi:hypothetical protein